MRETSFRQKAAAIGSLTVRPLMISTFIALGTAWSISIIDGVWPSADPEESNHGPWRHFYLGRELLEMAIVLPVISACMGFLAHLFDRKSRHFVLTLWGIPISLLILVSHFWLID